MAAQSRPEPSPAGTVVFTGGTLEAALSTARAACGPRVEVVRALRIRRGVRGLLGQVRYEVHVRQPETVAHVVGTPAPRAPRPGQPAPTRSPAPPSGQDGLADALRALVDEADEQERSGAQEPSWAWSGGAEVSALLQDVAALRTAGGEPPPGHPAPDLAWPTPPSPGRSVPSEAAHSASRAEAAAAPDQWRDLLADALDGAVTAAAPGRTLAGEVIVGPAPDSAVVNWDRGALRSIGVPPAVLRRLPVEDPVDDAGWQRALREAIAAVVPEPAEPDADHPVVVSGHGLPGAIAVLRAAVEDGAVPGTISFRGRRRPAGPGALVEVLAACARS